MLVPDEVRKCAAFVWFSSKDGQRLAGTAFFVSVPAGELGSTFIFLVTARHVIDAIRAKSVDQKVNIRINTKDASTTSLETDVANWLLHPDGKSVDVAVLPWAPPPDVIDYLCIPDTMAATDEVITNKGIGAGDEVFLTGLFASHVGRQRNLPIIRIGNISLMPEEPVETGDLGLIDAYLVEARSIGGLSGSPVFVHIAGSRLVRGTRQFTSSQFFWLGLMHGHWDIPVTDLDTPSEDATNTQRVNMGIAIVIPVTKILEVINSKELLEARAKVTEERRKELSGDVPTKIE